MRVSKVFFLVFCVAAFVYGLIFEFHAVNALSQENVMKIDGPSFTEIASYDGVIKREGRLFDVYSVIGVNIKADESGNIKIDNALSEYSSQTKDCKT